ncbi:MAG: WbqC family protein [Barnesiella sp.]|nr:WbqC family protein [Barnesiella sp.]
MATSPHTERSTILLPPQMLGSVDYYAAIAAFENVVVDTSMRFDKRFKSTHRTTIADANGTMMLTVPIVRPQSLSTALWSDIKVSDHNAWWNLMMTALRSAYGRTPYYEYYDDDFQQLIGPHAAGMTLMEFDRQLDMLVRRLAGITSNVVYAPARTIVDGDVADYRRKPIDFTHPVAYYQVRALRHGFISGLSIVDLLFNLGPETPLILRDSI